MTAESWSYSDSLIRWGNWCGPGYAGGQIVGPGPVAPEIWRIPGVLIIGRDGIERESLVDGVCKRHDDAIGRAEGQPDERQRILVADLVMLRELAVIFQTSRLQMSAAEENYALKAAVGFVYKTTYWNLPAAVVDDAKGWLNTIIGKVRLSDGTSGSELVDRVLAAGEVDGSALHGLTNSSQLFGFDAQLGPLPTAWQGHALYDLLPMSSGLPYGFDNPFGYSELGASLGPAIAYDHWSVAWFQDDFRFSLASEGIFGEALSSGLPVLSDVITDDVQIVNLLGRLGAPDWEDWGRNSGMANNGNPLSAWEGQASGLGGAAMAESYRIM